MALPLRTHPPAVVQSIPPDLASPSAAHSTAACPKAISIYAMQKTGSTFLGRFSREITLHKKMCRTYQNTKEYVCQTTISSTALGIRTTGKPCPSSRHSPQLPEHKGRARCNSMLRGKMFDSASDWLRSTTSRSIPLQSISRLALSAGRVLARAAAPALYGVRRWAIRSVYSSSVCAIQWR